MFDSLQLELIDELGTYAYDPLRFVLWAFPWTENGELQTFTGPEPWQRKVLEELRDGLLTAEQAIQLAVASGHGVGKSALVSWITLWAFSTFPGTRGVITANTENQLKTKTWVEIAKWFRLFIARDLFKLTATALFSTDEETAREWRIDIVPWSEKNSEAFAGLHNQGKRILILFDEASTIHESIWETTQGALTDQNTEIIWCCFGNPTQPDGRFRQCFLGGQFERRWKTFSVDSRDVSFTNKEQIESFIEDYGLDSDFIRIRVLGEFPKNAVDSFISFENALLATVRQVEDQREFPVILGVDVARFGTDYSVIYPRQGRDARSRKVERYLGLDTVQLTARVIQAINHYNAAAVVVDETGIGGGVVDQLRAANVNVHGVTFNSRADGFETGIAYYNKRAEIWGAMRAFINIGAIPKFFDSSSDNSKSFPVQLSEVQYSHSKDKRGSIILEDKKLVKTRTGVSPDEADALALTLAFPWLESIIPDSFSAPPDDPRLQSDGGIHMKQPKVPALPYPTSTADVYPSLLGPDPYMTDPNVLTSPKQRKPTSRPAQRTLIGGDLYA